MRYITKQSVIVSLCLVIFAITAICVRVESQNKLSQGYKIGGIVELKAEIKDISSSDTSLSRQTITILNRKKFNFNETYFRPSRVKSLNNNFMDFETFTQTFKNDSIPPSLVDTPLNSLLNYFSVLQQASYMTESKSGGCGTIGFAQTPYPIAYNFLSENNKKSMTYDEYLASFGGIGHINLIKVIPIITEEIDKYKYFLELEILEGTSIGATTFNYYTGEITIIDRGKSFYIDSLILTPEDFLCAAYHGWAHDAETFVEVVYGNWSGLIMKQYSPQVSENTKDIIVDGIDGEKYMFKFARLTNGTDLLINTLIKTQNNWVPIVIDTNQDIGKMT